MLGHNIFKKYKSWAQLNEERINTYANHLIVIFAFSVPILISVRRVSISLIILLFIARGRILHYMNNVLRDPLVLSFFLYFLVHFIWLVGTDDFIAANKSVHDASFLLFTPLFATFIDRKYVKRIAGAFILGMFVSVITSYGLLFELIPPMLHNSNQGTANDPTPLYHHTHYGYMLAVTSILLLCESLYIKENRFKMVAVFTLAVAIALNIFIIKGRSGYIIFVVLLVVMILLYFKSRAIKPLLISVLIMAIISVMAYSYIDVFKNRVDITVRSLQLLESEKNYNTSLGASDGIFIYSLDVIADNIAFGNGTGDHVSEVRKKAEKEGWELSSLVKSLPHLHNEYISSLMQFGLLGLIAFLNIPYQMLRYSSGPNRLALKVVGISILLYSLIDVFIIGLGMLLMVVTLSSVSLSRYPVSNTIFSKLNTRQLVIYALVILFFYLIKAYL